MCGASASKMKLYTGIGVRFAVEYLFLLECYLRVQAEVAKHATMRTQSHIA
jgi:hypothetical protein